MLSRANLFHSVGALEGVDVHRIVVARLQRVLQSRFLRHFNARGIPALRSDA